MFSDLTWIIKGLPVAILVFLILFIRSSPETTVDPGTKTPPAPTVTVTIAGIDPTAIYLICQEQKFEQIERVLLCTEVKE